MEQRLADPRRARVADRISDRGRLRVACANAPGVVAAITGFLHARGASVVQLDYDFTDPARAHLVLRLVFQLPNLAGMVENLERDFRLEVASRYGMTFRIRDESVKTRVAVMVSKDAHCLRELLWRQKTGELPIEIAHVLSNHPDLREEVEPYDVPYVHIPVTVASRARAEDRELALCADRVDLVVLARYMQILSGDFLSRLGIPVINIHHSLLPAFVGARPYEQAKQRGVKMLGATAHYATEVLDEGPIIGQAAVQVTHRQTVRDLQQMGADIERAVLNSAVLAHCEDRVFVYSGTTVVF